MRLVHPSRRGRLTETFPDRLDRHGPTTEILVGRLSRLGQTAKKSLVRLSREGQMIGTVIAQIVRLARMTVMHRDRLGLRDRITETVILGLFHRRGQRGRGNKTRETFLDRPYRPDRARGTCLGDRMNRIVMSVNGAKNSSGQRN
jgi:hypothetical protein